jgi:branched-subunit amino acid ABC-type transport system permease component
MFWQLLLNALVAASTAIPLAIGCAVMYWVVGFFDFSLGAAFVGAAYCSFILEHGVGLPLFFALPCGVGMGAVLGVSSRAFVYRPLAEKGSGSLLLLLASLGVYIAFQNSISLAFGDASKSLLSGPVQAGYEVLGGRITGIQIVTILGSLCLVIGLELLQNFTQAGRILRAVANDSKLAGIVGIPAHKWILIAHAIAGGLAGLSGVLVAVNLDVSPTVGMGYFMIATVAVIVGGFSSVAGVALAVLLIACAGQFGVWKLSSQWQGSVTFAILLAFMVLRPRGFFGKPLRKAAV